MIGTLEEASLVLDSYNCGDSTYLLSAEGSTRLVYEIGDVVYKVEFYLGTNASEYRHMTDQSIIDDLPYGVFFPKVSLYTVEDTEVIAMEFIDGQAVHDCENWCEGSHEDNCMPDYVKAMLVGYVNDTGGNNVIVNESGVWIIDCGDE